MTPPSVSQPNCDRNRLKKTFFLSAQDFFLLAARALQLSVNSVRLNEMGPFSSLCRQDGRPGGATQTPPSPPLRGLEDVGETLQLLFLSIKMSELVVSQKESLHTGCIAFKKK